nr:4-oxalocrotonate tautomerase family protein [Variovorax sp. E3]
MAQTGTGTKENTMPYVNVRITRDGVTREQKATVIAEITDTLQRVLGKKPELTHVVIDEINTDDWGFAGETTTVIRAREAAR